MALDCLYPVPMGSAKPLRSYLLAYFIKRYINKLILLLWSYQIFGPAGRFPAWGMDIIHVVIFVYVTEEDSEWGCTAAVPPAMYCRRVVNTYLIWGPQTPPPFSPVLPRSSLVHFDCIRVAPPLLVSPGDQSRGSDSSTVKKDQIWSSHS